MEEGDRYLINYWNRRFPFCLVLPTDNSNKDSSELRNREQSRNKESLLQKVHLDRSIYISLLVSQWCLVVYLWTPSWGTEEEAREADNSPGKWETSHTNSGFIPYGIMWKLLAWDYFCLQHYLSLQPLQMVRPHQPLRLRME